MNVINISLKLLSVDCFNDIPGQQPFSIAQCSYTQPDKEGNPVEYLVLVKGFNNPYDKTSTGTCADRLAKFKPQMKMLVYGQLWTELKDKETKQIVEQPYILAHSIAAIPPELDYNNICLAGKMGKMPEKKTYESGKTNVQTSLFITNEKGKNYFYNITAWNKAGDIISRYVRVKENLGIEGSLLFESWTDKVTGEPRTGIRVTANKVRLMGSKDVQSSNDSPPDEF